MKYYVKYLKAPGEEHLSSKTFTGKIHADDYAATVAADREPEVLQEALKEYTTCHDFDYLAERIDKLRYDILFSFEEAGVSPAAQYHYLNALNNLDAAFCNLNLAAVDQAANTRR